jgi:hypothetical protein
VIGTFLSESRDLKHSCADLPARAAGWERRRPQSSNSYVADRDSSIKFVVYASLNPLFERGSVCIRLRVMAKIAVLTAGSTGGKAGSPAGCVQS